MSADKLLTLHQTLRAAAALLDSAAEQIRDAPLEPTGAHIYTIGESLAKVIDIQHAILKQRPDLAPICPERPEEESAANIRLGHVLVAADDLVEQNRSAEAIALLKAFSKEDPSAFHRDIAATALENLIERLQE